MSSHPAWKSWLKLVELFSVAVQYDFTMADITRIDDLQYAHSNAFDAVPEYAGLKRPKHHFCAHLAGDIWRYGPPRGYWCFGFEGFNKVIKGAARNSNCRSESVSIMRYWSMKSARHAERCRLCEE